MNLSSENVVKICPHCDKESFALKHQLKETKDFWVICDVHPLTEGHILIVPKKHISCVGEYEAKLLKEFVKLYKETSEFLFKEYGSVASFEHGIFGQTVFHSHIHFLPFPGKPEQIVPEGPDRFKRLKSLSELRSVFEKTGGYLFFSTGKAMWLVDDKLTQPRFFRDRFANVLGRPERGNWKNMREDTILMRKAGSEIEALKSKWKKFIQR